MKNLYYFPIFLIGLITSCTVNGDGTPGPRGPQGPEGPAGEDAPPFEAIAYVDPPISFNAGNNYGTFLQFDEEDLPFILESDKVLMYMLVGENPDGLDIWSPLPQTYFNNLGTFIYSFEFTQVDAFVFMDANFNLDLLGAGDTDNKIFRVLIVPAESTSARSSSPLDYNNYYDVMEYYRLQESDIKSFANH